MIDEQGLAIGEVIRSRRSSSFKNHQSSLINRQL